MQKMHKPTPADDFTYTSEELLEIRRTKEDLIRWEKAIAAAKKAYCLFLYAPGPVVRAKSTAQITATGNKLRFELRTARNGLRMAQAAYAEAVVPARLVHQRLVKIITDDFRELLPRESFMSQLLPVSTMARLVGSNRCNNCKEFRHETILFDVRKTSAAIAICPACLLEILKTTEYMKNGDPTK